jgi:hypothetical protein
VLLTDIGVISIIVIIITIIIDIIYVFGSMTWNARNLG